MTAVLADFDVATGQTVSPISHTIPADWSVGDFVLAVVDTGVRTVTAVPDGWDLVDKHTNQNYYIYEKFLDAGDLGESQSWTLTSNTNTSYILFIRITGADGTTPINDWDESSSSNSTDHICPSVDTTVNDCLLIHLFLAATATLTPSTGAGSEAYNDGARKIFEQVIASAGSTGTGTYTTSITRSYNFYTIAIAPAAGGGVVIPVFRHHYRQMKF